MKKMHRIRKKTRLIAVAAVLMLLPGCATLIGARNLEMFEQTAKSYKHAISTSDFDTAIRFTEAEAPDAQGTAAPKNPPGMAKLDNIKVVHYEVKKITVSEDKQDVFQEVEISYYSKKTMIQTLLRDQQHWQFHQDMNQWILESGLPKFK